MFEFISKKWIVLLRKCCFFVCSCILGEALFPCKYFLKNKYLCFLYHLPSVLPAHYYAIGTINSYNPIKMSSAELKPSVDSWVRCLQALFVVVAWSSRCSPPEELRELDPLKDQECLRHHVRCCVPVSVYRDFARIAMQHAMVKRLTEVRSRPLDAELLRCNRIWIQEVPWLKRSQFGDAAGSLEYVGNNNW